MQEVLTLSTMLAGVGGGIVVPFINKLLGPAADEVGTMIAERARMYRLQNTFILFRKAQEAAEKAGFDPQQVNLKTLLPLIEGASIEDDPSLADKWASLLANAANPANLIDIKPAYAEILRQLAPREALLLDRLFAIADEHNGLTRGYYSGDSNRSISIVRKSDALHHILDLRSIRYEYGHNQNLGGLHEFDAMSDNLLRQRLLVLGKSSQPKQNPSFSLDFKPDADTAFFSSFGFDFMVACIPPKPNSNLT